MGNASISASSSVQTLDTFLEIARRRSEGGDHVVDLAHIHERLPRLSVYKRMCRALAHPSCAPDVGEIAGLDIMARAGTSSRRSTPSPLLRLCLLRACCLLLSQTTCLGAKTDVRS